MEINKVENIALTQPIEPEALLPERQIRDDLSRDELTKAIAGTALANFMPGIPPAIALSVVTPLREQPVSELEAKYGKKFPRAAFNKGAGNIQSGDSLDMVA